MPIRKEEEAKACSSFFEKLKYLLTFALDFRIFGGPLMSTDCSLKTRLGQYDILSGTYLDRKQVLF